MDRVPGSIMDACVHAHVPVPVCLLPLVLPPSALKHAPQPRLPGSQSLKFLTGAGEGVQRGTQCCPPTPTGGVVPQSWTVMGGSSNQIALFPLLPHAPPTPRPAPLFFLGVLWSSTSREISLARGRGLGTPLGDLLSENAGLITWRGKLRSRPG